MGALQPVPVVGKCRLFSFEKALPVLREIQAARVVDRIGQCLLGGYLVRGEVRGREREPLAHFVKTSCYRVIGEEVFEIALDVKQVAHGGLILGAGKSSHWAAAFLLCHSKRRLP